MNNRYGLYRTRIGRYFPRYYEGILETDELIKVEMIFGITYICY